MQYSSVPVATQFPSMQNFQILFPLPFLSPEMMSQSYQNDFWHLWLSHQAYLYRCCLRWMGYNSMDAEDALSLAMGKAYRKFPLYAAQIRRSRSWLTKLCYRTCLDLHRSTRPSISWDEVNVEMTTPDHLAPFEQAIAIEIEEVLSQSLQQLPPLLRQAFILHCLQNLPYNEVAQRLKITPANARKRVEQARVKLKVRLHAYLPSA